MGERGNCVQKVYQAFTDDEISEEISRMVYPENIDWDGEVQVIFQTIENLHSAIKGTPVIGISPATIRLPAATRW